MKAKVDVTFDDAVQVDVVKVRRRLLRPRVLLRCTAGNDEPSFQWVSLGEGVKFNLFFKHDGNE